MSRPSHTRRAGRRSRSLRDEMTVSEVTLWKAIRSQATGARFRRQVPIGEYITDFASFDPRLIIEVDGQHHYERDEEPRFRYLESRGFQVLSYENRDIALQLREVVVHICDSVDAARAGRQVPKW